MNKKKIVDRFVELSYIMNRKKIVKKSNKRYFSMLEKRNIPIRRLTSEQKKAVDSIYKKYGFSYSYDTHELVYSVTGKFYPDIVPEDLFRTEVEIYLNDINSKYVLSDKNYFNVYMKDVRFPCTIVRNVEGVFYDHDYNVISKEKALEIINEYDKVVYKPSMENGIGKGVALVDTASESPLDYGPKNYVIQKVLRQHSALAKLNESSVNVCRMCTAFIDGQVVVLTAALRIGAKGAFNDNSISEDGMGMIVVGIDENGKLKDRGYYSCGLSTPCNADGVEFAGYEIPNFDKMVELAKKGHSMFPRIKFIAWDLCVEESGDIVCMEYNVKGPGVLYYQYVNGPLFGKYSKKILSYAESEKKKRKLF